MANLARFDPFQLTRLDPFESMVRDLVPASLRSLMRTWEKPAIRVEVREQDNGYLMTAELPGVRNEDIDISIAGNQVAISAETRQERLAEGAREWCNECAYGKFSRTLQLPLEIEEQGADASYADGLLHLTLPKKVQRGEEAGNSLSTVKAVLPAHPSWGPATRRKAGSRSP